MDLTNYVTLEFFDEKLAAKQDNLTAGSNISITDEDGKFIISAVDTTYSNATQQTSGLMSPADKTKLDGITAESIDAAIEDYLNSHDADIVTEQELHEEIADSIGNYNDIMIPLLDKKQDTLTAGENITIADNNGDLTISATDTTYSAATASAPGLMSAADKAKLDGIEAGAQVNTVTGVKGANEADYRIGNVSISKGNVGLGNVDNTADADKPISTAAQTALDGKVDKITGKGLSEANFTDVEKTKLAGIAVGAEVNVQSDWNQGNDAADDYIKNKPSNLVQDASYVHTDNNFTNAEKAKADGAIQSTEKGAANGVAELDANGKVPTSQLPAYVDDVLSYNSLSDFPATGEDGKIYIAKDTNLSYRWGSSEYVVISPSLALGSTSSTAYRGDWGAEDRAAIGTLSTLNTTEKSNLVGAINELKTASDAKQGTLTFDSAPTSGSTNPVTSGGVYTALAGKQETLTFDDVPTENSDKLVKSGGIYNALAGKADATATQTALNSKADATATQTALAGKQNALTAGANITIETVNDALTISATDTTYSAATTSVDGLMSATDKTKLNGIAEGAQVNVKPDWSAASGSAAEILNKPANLVQDASYVHTDSNFTAAEKTKLDGVAAGAEVNQNAFSNITVGNDTIAAEATTDTIGLIAGANVTLTADTANDTVTISATDTTYSDATQQTHGLMSATDKTKLDGVQTGAAAVSVTQTLSSGTKIGTVTVNGTGTDLYCETNTDTTYSAGTGLSLSGTTFSNSAPNVKSDWNAASGSDAEILNKPTIPSYSAATQSAAGLMSAADKIKLDKMVVISASDYEAFDALNPPDSGTIYFVLEASGS